jgi:outer membrane protein, multidrug efflux system
MKILPRFLLMSLGVSLGGCNLAPTYVAPPVEVPASFKEAEGTAPVVVKGSSRPEGGTTTDGGPQWLSADPADLRPRGPWWGPFKDKQLDALERELDARNPDIEAAVAAMDRAHALAAKAASGLSPTLTASGQLTENKESLHRPLRLSGTYPSAGDYARAALSQGLPINSPTFFGDNQLTAQATYEIDLWGRVRNLAGAGAAQAQASEADLAAIALSLQAELARDYISLQGLDNEVALQKRIIAAYAGSLELVQKRVRGGIASPADVTRAQTQLDFAKAQLSDIEARRALLEHAVAILAGRPPEGFSLPSSQRRVASPTIPLGAPSQLLERRPDIAAAERRVNSANLSIGVARAAFFPRFTINLSGGTQDTGLSLFNARNSLWSVGPAVTLPIFDGGAHAADLHDAEAAYLEAVARYRGVVLRAYGEVEDALAQIRFLDRQEKDIASAVVAGGKTLDVSLKLYEEGVVTYVEVVTAQSDAFAAQRQAIALRTARLQAALSLMAALGGGWTAPVFTPPASEQPCALCELATQAAPKS